MHCQLALSVLAVVVEKACALPATSSNVGHGSQTKFKAAMITVDQIQPVTTRGREASTPQSLIRHEVKAAGVVVNDRKGTLPQLQEDCRKQRERLSLAEQPLHSAPVLGANDQGRIDPCKQLEESMKPATLWNHVVVKDADGNLTQMPTATDDNGEDASTKDKGMLGAVIAITLTCFLCVIAGIVGQRALLDRKGKIIKKEKEVLKAAEAEATKGSASNEATKGSASNEATEASRASASSEGASRASARNEGTVEAPATQQAPTSSAPEDAP